ncbi:hypothetical protein M427DRAFT_65199 [Gonapodya prolifera JEL478]|uniref:Uncharacterized protein n=1 Tax=Gonapodya prolifera (strain JEL478) TaxID=1344416 RepID=A0A139B097_GONPJ|nr:hypothetical protein M427DRAFT_65199 [Gonapodya prolifera JEL478]|eukprot:KXS22125.1 hypothetical protein M427DRAFT_65199 [Gonapodya prolifera JEL478]
MTDSQTSPEPVDDAKRSLEDRNSKKRSGNPDEADSLTGQLGLSGALPMKRKRTARWGPAPDTSDTEGLGGVWAMYKAVDLSDGELAKVDPPLAVPETAPSQTPGGHGDAVLSETQSASNANQKRKRLVSESGCGNEEGTTGPDKRGRWALGEEPALCDGDKAAEINSLVPEKQAEDLAICSGSSTQSLNDGPCETNSAPTPPDSFDVREPSVEVDEKCTTPSQNEDESPATTLLKRKREPSQEIAALDEITTTSSATQHNNRPKGPLSQSVNATTRPPPSPPIEVPPPPPPVEKRGAPPVETRANLPPLQLTENLRKKNIIIHRNLCAAWESVQRSRIKREKEAQALSDYGITVRQPPRTITVVPFPGDPLLTPTSTEAEVVAYYFEQARLEHEKKLNKVAGNKEDQGPLEEGEVPQTNRKKKQVQGI